MSLARIADQARRQRWTRRVQGGVMQNARNRQDYRIEVNPDAGHWRWSVSRDREMAAGHAPTLLTATGSAQVAAGVISGLGRIARRRF